MSVTKLLFVLASSIWKQLITKGCKETQFVHEFNNLLPKAKQARQALLTIERTAFGSCLGVSWYVLISENIPCDSGEQGENSSYQIKHEERLSNIYQPAY